MAITTLPRDAVKVEDIEYLRHGDQPLLARIHQPAGKGPFPLVINVHGGAWIRKDRLAGGELDMQLAQSGIVVASLDFRMPPQAAYPASLQDINYAVRWFKANAARFASTASQVCLMGFSSGAHQAILNTLRRSNPRYAALPLAGAPGIDASVRAVAMCSPLVDPQERFHYAIGLKAAGPHAFAERVLPGHYQYWGTEAAMAEGNPIVTLERGEAEQTPPVLYASLMKDGSHPRVSLERFVAAYRKAGGKLDLQFFDEATGDSFMTGDPNTPAAQAAIKAVIEFIHREAGQP
jgi:acetyl esterase/lipase